MSREDFIIHVFCLVDLFLIQTKMMRKEERPAEILNFDIHLKLKIFHHFVGKPVFGGKVFYDNAVLIKPGPALIIKEFRLSIKAKVNIIYNAMIRITY